MKPNNNFKAIYNPFNKKMVVKYGDCITEYEFTEEEEWTKVSFNGDNKHPNYLHIQLDYDETLQLLFYPRVSSIDAYENESLNEDLGVYFNSGDMNNIPDKIKIVYNDYQFEEGIKTLYLI